MRNWFRCARKEKRLNANIGCLQHQPEEETVMQSDSIMADDVSKLGNNYTPLDDDDLRLEV